MTRHVRARRNRVKLDWAAVDDAIANYLVFEPPPSLSCRDYSPCPNTGTHKATTRLPRTCAVNRG
jgi:hypothetical protein